jgi:hypothetical protein
MRSKIPLRLNSRPADVTRVHELTNPSMKDRKYRDL